MLRLAILFGLSAGLAAGLGGPLGRGAAAALTGQQIEAMR